MQKRNLRTGRLLWLGCAVIVIGVPFHALATAWLASHFGHFDALRLWKEYILVVLAVASVYQVVRHPSLRRDLQSNRIVQAGIAYMAFILLMTLAGLAADSTSLAAALYGLVIDTRIVLFVLVIMVAGSLSPLPVTRRRWILIPAALVIGFGLLQFVLPADILRHAGYGPDTLPAFQPVDGKPELARIQSSLRGPNPLGAYLLPVLMTAISLGLVNKKRRLSMGLFFAAGLTVLVGTYSRSALLGLLLAIAVFCYWSLPRRHLKLFTATLAMFVLLAGGLTMVLKNNDHFQNFVFHSNEQSPSASSSNSARLSALREGARDIVKHPLGNGVGTAGPASQHNSKRAPRIAESFYLQIGQEAGLVGLILFILLLWAIGKELWAHRANILVRAALASFVGLLFVNAVSHAWADDTLAYVFFGLVGFVVVKTSTKSENLAKL